MKSGNTIAAQPNIRAPQFVTLYCCLYGVCIANSKKIYTFVPTNDGVLVVPYGI